MPFRLTARSKTNKSADPGSNSSSTANSTTDNAPLARSVSALPPRLPPSSFRLGRGKAPTKVSFEYDNGTGKLHPQFVRDQGLPVQVKTTDELYAFMQSRAQNGAFSSSSSSSLMSPSSRYSTPSSSVVSQNRAGSYVSVLGVQTNPFGHPARGSVAEGQEQGQGQGRKATATAMATAAVVDPVMAGLRRRYAGAPVERVLQGATRKHEFQGYWMQRGTMRGLEVKLRKSWWKKTTELSVEQGQKGSASGWYH